MDMEMDVMLIVKIVLAFVLTSVIPFATAIIGGIKKSKSAKTEAEKQTALNEMSNVVMTFILNAEQLYKDVNAVIKQRGSSCGALKKESVMANLQAYAFDKGYDFDAEYWSNKIDEIVTLTKQVNA